MYIRKERFDYILVWANGLKYSESIIEIIRNTPNIEILAIRKYYPKSISRFVKHVYSFDYAPFKHLSDKTEYLRRSKSEVLFVFILNKMPIEYLSSPNTEFEHIESNTIKNIKSIIRDKFNERKDNRITENHVIHASDNEHQTDYILRYLGYKKGIGIFKKNVNPILSAPFHLDCFNTFTLRLVDISNIYCSIFTASKSHYTCNIFDTPHFKFLQGDTQPYLDYRLLYEQFGYLMDDQLPDLFRKFAFEFNYLEKPHSTAYILAREIDNGKYQIIDGVHRLSILANRKVNSIIIAVIV